MTYPNAERREPRIEFRNGVEGLQVQNGERKEEAGLCVPLKRRYGGL